MEVETAKNNDSLPECTFLKTSFYPLSTDGSPLRPRESAHFFSPCSSSVSLPASEACLSHRRRYTRRGAKSYERVHGAGIEGGGRGPGRGGPRRTKSASIRWTGGGVSSGGWAGWVVHIRWATYNARTLGALEAPQAIPL